MIARHSADQLSALIEWIKVRRGEPKWIVHVMIQLSLFTLYVTLSTFNFHFACHTLHVTLHASLVITFQPHRLQEQLTLPLHIVVNNFVHVNCARFNSSRLFCFWPHDSTGLISKQRAVGILALYWQFQSSLSHFILIFALFVANLKEYFVSYSTNLTYYCGCLARVTHDRKYLAHSLHCCALPIVKQCCIFSCQLSNCTPIGCF